MSRAWHLVAAAGAGVLAFLALGLAKADRPPPCAHCSQDVAAATYFAINQLDCDGQTGDGGCGTFAAGSASGATDELQDVAQAPVVESITTDPKTRDVTVRIGIYYVDSPHTATGPTSYFDVTFLPDGQFLDGR